MWTIASTSIVGRTGAAPGSVSNRPEAQPPTKTIRSSNGTSFSTAERRSPAFGFCIGLTAGRFSQSILGLQDLARVPGHREWRPQELTVHRVWDPAGLPPANFCTAVRTLIRAQNRSHRAKPEAGQKIRLVAD